MTDNTKKNVLVYIEITNNKVENVSKEIISYVNNNFDNVSVNGVVIADESTINNSLNDLRALRIDYLYVLQDNLYDTKNTCLYANALQNFIEENRPDILLMGATCEGRDLAPRLASKLNIGLTADCTGLKLDENGKLLATRPTYGGKMMATIYSKTLPNFATIRPSAFKNDNIFTEHTPKFIYPKQNICGTCALAEILSSEDKIQPEDWTCAEVIVAGGLGLKTKSNFDLIYKLAEKLSAKPAASRAAVEQGWASKDIQIGQTGSSISPKLYIAFGISGAMQHLVGITNSDKIIAVNTDKNAPIMKIADYAIVADAENVLKEMLV